MIGTVVYASFALLAGLATADHRPDGQCDYSNFDRDTYASIKDTQLNIGHYLAKGFALAHEKRARKVRVLKHYEGTHSMRPPFGYVVKRAKSKTAKLSSCQGLGLLETSKYVIKSQNWTKDVSYNALRSIAIPQDLFAHLLYTCEDLSYGTQIEFHPYDKKSDHCVKYKYRSADGSCNNPDHYKWGAALEAFQRCIPPEYSDGLGAFRGSSGDYPLPNPRRISVVLRDRPVPKKSTAVTQLLKVWGQFTDHDIVKTPETPAGLDEDDDPIDIPCCEDGLDENSPFEDCRPIFVPYDDVFFRNQSIECLRFVRSTPFSTGAVLEPREQLSETSAFLDASNVYGSSLKEQRALRTLSYGLLSTGEGVEPGCTRTCPLSYLPEEIKLDPENFFAAGDDRVNEQPSLTSMHTVWVRFHNKVAGLIYDYTRETDEIVFQETRRIIAALMQQITYTEFLPPVLGPKFLAENGLSTPNIAKQDSQGYNTLYEKELSPTIFNVVGAAAYRFGHTLISNDMLGKTEFKLENNFFRGELQKVTDHHPSDILQGEMLTPAEGMDAVFDEVITNRLLAEDPFDNGNDLMALNILRGRDHGISGYNKWREFCQLQPLRNFDEMRAELDPVVVEMFESLYRTIDDVDLYVSGLAERPISDGLLGPTFSCLLLKQFKNIKYGDRFWYENGPSIHKHNPEAAFTPYQLETIRKTSLAFVMCQSTNIRFTPVRPMEVSSCSGENGNPIVACEDLESGRVIESLTSGYWWKGTRYYHH